MQSKFAKNLFCLAVFALALFASGSLSAQNQGATRGNLGGTVFDPTKAVVPDATVTITGPIGNQVQSTNPQGAFLFSALIPGFYSVKIEKSGFAVTTVPGVEVLINNKASVDVTLQTATVTAMVEVTATSVATVDTGSSSINSDLSDALYNNIPIQRNVSSIMMLAPGVVSGLGTSQSLAPNYTHTVVGSPASYSNPSISGASGLENLYVADGVVLNDPSFGGIGGFSTVYGPLGVGITPAFVKEEEVKTAGFEPQYGHATGGVIQIVTKSGSDHMHGTIGGYFEAPGMQTAFLNKDNFNPTNELGKQLHNGEYEGDVELGGYVPHFKNHLYYFGAFDPTFFDDYEAPAAGFGLFTIYNGQVVRKTTTLAYAGKLTYKVNNSINIESSVFGDPSHMAAVPYSTLTANNTSGNSSFNYGTRNFDVRLYASITPTWEADFAFSYAWNHFTETQADTSIYPITDQTQTAAGQLGQFTAQGLGSGILVNYKSHSEALSFDTSKIANFAGKHTFSVGYFWQYPTYDDVTKYSTPTYAIPATNASGTSAGTASAAGKMSDASLQLQLAPLGCTACPSMMLPDPSTGLLTAQQVVLFQARGRFDGGLSHNTGKYHAAYVNDSWQMSPHVTLNLGLRWEQQRLNGTAARAFFNDQWSPRIGFIVSPNPDSKIYVDFDRLAYVLPLDMAVRELSSEDDNLNEYWAPDSDSSGMVTLNKYGTVNFDPIASHLLNGASGGVASPASIEIQSGGEPFVPATRMESNDEWVVGAEHKFRGGFNASVKYIDRRMTRVVEDMVGQSVEQLTALAFNGGSYTYVIGNPSATFAHFVSPNEITWIPTQAQLDAYNSPTGTFLSLGPPPGCFDSAGNPTPFMSGPMNNTYGVLQGAACFPAVNGQLNTSSLALFGGEYFPGTPGTSTGCPKTSTGASYCKAGLYPNAIRNYQAVEFEVNKAFGNNWQLHSNFRIGKLAGNYEGAFRNDNNQSDPGISSLFDLTSGALGLLGSQLGIGHLNTDRKYVLNVETSYVIPSSFVKNLTLGTALNVQTGIPLTTLAAQFIYNQPGEAPLFGRGDLGRSPTTGTIDAHLEYPIHITEGKQLKLQFDAFNIANTKRPILTTQQVDLSFGVLNQDFINKVPLSFVPPFSARAAIMFTF